MVGIYKITNKINVKSYIGQNEGHKKKIVCVETNQVFDSVKEAAKYLHLTDGSGLSAVLKGRRKTCKGFHFEYVV